MQNDNYEPQIGDWIIPSDDAVIDSIAYGFNKRLIIEISADKEEFTTVCDACLLYTSPSPRDGLLSRMPSSA